MPRFVGGALLAAAAAGPSLVLTSLIRFSIAAGQWSGFGSDLFLVLLFASLFGFVIAMIPSLIGSAALARSGLREPWLRHPLLWASAGLAIGTLVGIPFLGFIGSGTGTRPLLNGSFAFGIAALPCALLARWRTKWPE